MWEDQEDKYGLRPQEITLQLQQNGVDFLDAVYVKADAEGNWTYTFEKLPLKDAKGDDYNYRVVEEKVVAYEDPQYATDPDTGSYLITNKLDVIDIPLTKQWADMDNKYGLRPSEIKVQLKQNGNNLFEPVVLSEKDEWKHLFTNLPLLDSKGTAYVYTFEEHPVAAYETSYKEGLIENTLILKDVLVKKEWKDSEDKLGLRPKTITLQLLQNGQAFLDPVVVHTEKGSVQEVKFAALPVMDETGKVYTYTVEEVQVDKNYQVSYGSDGLTVINTVIPPEDPPKDPPKKPALPSTGEDGGSLAFFAALFLGLGLILRRRRLSH